MTTRVYFRKLRAEDFHQALRGDHSRSYIECLFTVQPEYAEPGLKINRCRLDNYLDLMTFVDLVIAPKFLIPWRALEEAARYAEHGTAMRKKLTLLGIAE